MGGLDKQGEEHPLFRLGFTTMCRAFCRGAKTIETPRNRPGGLKGGVNEEKQERTNWGSLGGSICPDDKGVLIKGRGKTGKSGTSSAPVVLGGWGERSTVSTMGGKGVYHRKERLLVKGGKKRGNLEKCEAGRARVNLESGVKRCRTELRFVKVVRRVP